MKLVLHWLLMGGLLTTFGTAKRGLGGAGLAVPYVTAHLSTASVPITVLLNNGPLLCGLMCPFMVTIYSI